MTLNAIKRSFENLAFNDRTQSVTGTVITVETYSEQEISGSGGGGGGKISGGGGYMHNGTGSTSSIKGNIKIDEIKIESKTHHLQKVFLLGSDKKEYVFEVNPDELSLRQGTVMTFLWLGGPDTPRIVARKDMLFAHNHNTSEVLTTGRLWPFTSPAPRPAFTLHSVLAFFGILLIGMFVVFKVSPFGFIGNSLLFILTLILAFKVPSRFDEDITDYDHAAECKSTFKAYQDAVSKFDTSELDTVSQT